MFKKILLVSMLVLLVTLSFGTVFSAGPSQIEPDLFLTVQQSPLAIYPPIMIYTATLNWPLPIVSTTQIMVNFYNGPAITMPPMVLIGSAPLDLRTGKAVLNKQMQAGSWEAVAQTTINGQTHVSNAVFYKVP